MAKKRRPRYKTDPISGLTYERGSLMDLGIHAEKNMYSSLKKARSNQSYSSYNRRRKPYQKPSYKKRRRKTYYREPSYNLEDIPPEAWIIFGAILGIYLLWYYVIIPFMEWVEQNIVLVVTTISVVFVIFMIILYFVVFRKIRRWKRRKVFEREQESKGLVKFVNRFGNDVWCKPEELSKLQGEDRMLAEKESLPGRIIDVIKNFEPSQAWQNEQGYHGELQGHLRSKFPEAKVEIQLGRSRPDIVIGDIAIEVKGPTTSRDLVTIPDKCMRYSKHFKGGFIVVLFRVVAGESMYDEWLAGLNEQYPNVVVIRK